MPVINNITEIIQLKSNFYYKKKYLQHLWKIKENQKWNLKEVLQKLKY